MYIYTLAYRQENFVNGFKPMLTPSLYPHKHTVSRSLSIISLSITPNISKEFRDLHVTSHIRFKVNVIVEVNQFVYYINR